MSSPETAGTSPETAGGRSHDLTARVATARVQQVGANRPQVLLVDDQPNQVLPWLERVLGEYTLLPVSNEDELRRLLDGHALERLPPGPYRPIAALVDLDLGGASSGLGAIRLLRSHPRTRLTTCILFSNGLAGRDDRDLHAVLCAYANGGGLLASTKDEPDGARLAVVLKAAEATAAAGGVLSPSGPLGGLRYVPSLRLRSVHTMRPPRDLVELLLGEPGLRALWRNYADAGADFDLAVNATRDQFPHFLRQRPQRTTEAPPARTADGGERTRTKPSRNHLANDLLSKKDFGEVPLSWYLYGGSFLQVPGSVLEPHGLGDEEEYTRHSARRRVLLGMFFARYGRLLMSRETHLFAQDHMSRVGAG